MLKEIAILAAVLLGIGMLFYVGTIAIVPDMKFDSEELIEVKDWKVEIGNDTKDVSFPITIKNKENVNISASSKLEAGEGYVNCFLLRTSAQYAKVYLDGKIILDYGKVEKLPFYMPPSSAWHIVRLPDGWEGKTLTIELTDKMGNPSGRFQQAYLGTKNACVYHVFKLFAGHLLYCALLFGFGAFLTVTSFLFNESIARGKLFYLGLLSIAFSIWIILESRGVQLVYGNLTNAYTLIFVVFGIIPVLLSRFFLCYRSFNKRNGLHVLFWCSIAVYVTILTLQFFDLVPFGRTVTLVHILMALIASYLIVVLIFKYIQKDVKEDAEIYMAGGALAFFAVLDVIRYYIAVQIDVSYFTRWGIVAMILILGYCAIKRAFFEKDFIKEQQLLKKLAFTDCLTGIGNRTAYNEALQFFDDDHSGTQPIFLMMDINELKMINDNYGHREGDEIIAFVAGEIDQWFGRIGKGYRIGGDEFCVILENSSKAEVERILNRFLSDIEKKNKGRAIPVSLAYGYCEADKKGVVNAIKMADSLMYEKKRNMKKEDKTGKVEK